MARVYLLAALAVAQPAFRSDVSLVNVAFSVRDARGMLVPELTRDDFEVFDDGAPQKIAFFARSTDVPLALGLIMDVSGSQEHFEKQHRKDLELFLKSTLDPRDRAFVVCFANGLRLVRDDSSSAHDLASGLEDFDKGHGTFPRLGPPEIRILGTAFYDAIYYAIKEKLSAAEQGRRALLLFSDGEDNSSAHHMLDAIEAAQANDVRIYGLRYTEIGKGGLNGRNKYGISVMNRIARETGGADFDAREKGLKEHFRVIGEELRTSYELAYHPTDAARDGTFHKILIRPKRAGLTVRAKSGYYARE